MDSPTAHIPQSAPDPNNMSRGQETRRRRIPRKARPEHRRPSRPRRVALPDHAKPRYVPVVNVPRPMYTADEPPSSALDLLDELDALEEADEIGEMLDTISKAAKAVGLEGW